MKLAFTIPGPPKPKERPRRGKGGRWYTPAATAKYERHVGACVQAALLEAGLYHSWRRDASKYNVTLMIVFRDRRHPDCDNCEKAILDGCSGANLLWTTDKSAVVREKDFAFDKLDPHVAVTVEAVL